MTDDAADLMPPEAELALAWSGQKVRGPLSMALQLDRRLARIVARTSEPMLGQMRLAWWRDALGTPLADRPRGDAVLDGLGAHWAGRESALIALVDGWEQVLEEPPLSERAARLFGEGRCAALLAVYDKTPEDTSDPGALYAAAWHWSFADFAARVSREEERALLVRLGLGLGNGHPALRLPREARGLAVLGALGLRALQRGGRPLMEGRGAPVAALRAAIFGR